MANTDNLFTPVTLGNLTLNNRIAMAPMTRTYSPGNVPNDLVVEYYKKRAQGGVGLIITEGTCVGHKAASGYDNVPFIAGEEALAGWKKVVDAVHQAGGKIAPQLWHVGGIRKPGIEPGGDLPGYSPSGKAAPGKVTGHEMTKQDIQDVINAFVQGAVDAKNIGFDAIEIHGAHGYLIDQFFWQETNTRTDEYGGDLAGRSRFAIELISAIRAAVGEDYPIIFRFSQWKQQDYSAQLAETPEQLKEFLTPLADAGVDIFHCSQRRYWEPEFPDSNLNLAGWVKKLTGKATITVGSVGLNQAFLPEDGTSHFQDAKAESLDNLIVRIDNQEFDLIAVGRALISNPDWVHKVQSGDVDNLKAFDRSQLAQLV